MLVVEIIKTRGEVHNVCLLCGEDIYRDGDIGDIINLDEEVFCVSFKDGKTRHYSMGYGDEVRLRKILVEDGLE